MRLQGILTDDDAVSPVIGVILMVAITVILAAVIATFVLGLGNQAGQATPQGSLSFDFDNSTNPPGFDGNLTISHDGGDSIIASEVFLRGDSFEDTSSVGWVANNTWAGYAFSGSGDNATVSGTSEGQPAIVAGDEAEIRADEDYEIDVVWEPAEGDTSATLASDSGPEA